MTSERIVTQLQASEATTQGRRGSVANLNEEELRAATFYRLEALGYRVGLGVVESISANAPLLPTAAATTNSGDTGQTSPSAALDTIKFLCKDFWSAVFHKQIDNLKTNHRGIFVLTDQRFDPLKRCSLPVNHSEANDAERERETTRKAGLFLFFPTGLIRGALSGLGLETTVTAEIAPMGLPGATFQIKTLGA